MALPRRLSTATISFVKLTIWASQDSRSGQLRAVLAWPPSFQTRSLCAVQASLWQGGLAFGSPVRWQLKNWLARMTWSEAAFQAHARTVSSQLHPSLSTERPKIHHVPNSFPHNQCLREKACKFTSLQFYRCTLEVQVNKSSLPITGELYECLPKIHCQVLKVLWSFNPV